MPDELHGESIRDQEKPTDQVLNLHDTEDDALLLPPATERPPTAPHFRCSIAGSDLSCAEHKLHSLQIAQSQVPTSSGLSVEEGEREALEADRAVADKFAEVEELRKEWLSSVANDVQRGNEGSDEE